MGFSNRQVDAVLLWKREKETLTLLFVRGRRRYLQSRHRTATYWVPSLSAFRVNQMSGGAKYAAMAKQSASRGSKRFVYVDVWDSREPFPNHFGRQGDNPFKNSYGWLKIRWLIHDVRIYGFRESFRRWYYLLDTWRNRGERIFAGEDDLGNRFWFSHMAKAPSGFRGGRFVEPADPHWFRGQDHHVCHPSWLLWLGGCTAHTPAQIKARGEYGPHGRLAGGTVPWRVQHRADTCLQGNDPCAIPNNQMLVSPWYKLMKESGFANFNYNTNPMHHPFAGEHDVKQEVVEDFYRHLAPYCRWSRGHDHDEWRN
jgi:hypothetical protein